MRALLLLVALAVAASLFASRETPGVPGADPFGAVALAASAQGGAEAELRALLDAQVAAWNRGDVEGFMQGYWKSDGTIFVGSGGVLRGWQAVLDRYHRSYPDRAAMGRLEFSQLEITPLAPDAAVILGHWQLVREKDRPGGYFTLIARRMPGGWRIIHDHTSAQLAPASKP